MRDRKAPPAAALSIGSRATGMAGNLAAEAEAFPATITRYEGLQAPVTTAVCSHIASVLGIAAALLCDDYLFSTESLKLKAT